MKSYKNLLGMGLLFLILSCGASQTLNNRSVTILDYKIIEKKIFADSIRTEVERMDPGINKRSAERNLEAIENPDPSFYRLTVQKNISRLSYLPPLETGEGSAFISHSTPFTRENSYKFKDSSAVYVDFNSKIAGAVMKVPNRKFQLKNVNHDTMILGKKAHLYIGKKNNEEVRAWIIDELPNDLGIYDLYSKDGFVLAYELIKEAEAPFQKQIIKVYPQKLRSRAKQDIRIPSWNKEMTKQEMLKHFKIQNKQ